MASAASPALCLQPPADEGECQVTSVLLVCATASGRQRYVDVFWSSACMGWGREERGRFSTKSLSNFDVSYLMLYHIAFKPKANQLISSRCAFPCAGSAPAHNGGMAAAAVAFFRSWPPPHSSPAPQTSRPRMPGRGGHMPAPTCSLASHPAIALRHMQLAICACCAFQVTHLHPSCVNHNR